MGLESITVISFSFIRGGAAKAALKFHNLATKILNAKCVSTDDSWTRFNHSYHFIKRVISFIFVFIYQKKSGIKCSANFFSFKPAIDALNDPEKLCHIHWINNDTISIYDFNKIPYSSIITLHDEWMYCGIEHYLNVNKEFDGSAYFSENNSQLNKHLSILHQHVWRVKRSAFAGRNDIIVTCPSRWLADRAKRSHVLKDCDVRILYNPIDTAVFSPLNYEELTKARVSLGIENRIFIIFGAVGGIENPLKGFKELEAALKLLSKNKLNQDKLMLGIFGGLSQGISELHGFPVHEFGYINCEKKMAEIYSLAHVTIVPSKLEAFGQVAAESQSCKTPVIAFDTSGITDVVIDGKTGFLAAPFSSNSLAEKIDLMISLSTDQYDQLCNNARQHVVDNFSNTVIENNYQSIIYEQLLKKKVSYS